MTDIPAGTRPAQEFADKLGVPLETIVAVLQRNGTFDPHGFRFGEIWVVDSWEFDGQRFAMHRRRLRTDSGTGHGR